MFLDHRLDHDIREILIDPDVPFQQIFHDLLVLRHAAGKVF